MAIEQAERELAHLVGVQEAIVFASARGALTGALVSLGAPQQVAVPAYTCATVANAVVSAGGRPVFVDIDSRGVVSSDAWPDCQVVITQDTYGFPAPIPDGRTVVRDAAHRIDLVDTAADVAVAVTSFDQSKSLSAGQGGLATTIDPDLAASMRRWRDTHDASRHRLHHSLVTLLTLVTGRLQYYGRPTFRLRQLVRALSPERVLGQTPAELAGQGVDPRLLGRPNGTVARLMVSQMRRSSALAAHRSRIVARYDLAAGISRAAQPLLRYPMWVADIADFDEQTRAAGWIVGRAWFQEMFEPPQSDAAPFGFASEDVPSAREFAAHVVALPTHPLVTDDEADQLISLALAAGARPLA